MEDKPLTESINKQYSKYGSLRTKEKESRIELCNTEDPTKFLTRIDSSIKDAKARVKQSIDKSTISEEFYESSYDQQHPPCDSSAIDTIPMVKIDRNKSGASLATSSPSSSSSSTSSSPAHSCPKGRSDRTKHVKSDEIANRTIEDESEDDKLNKKVLTRNRVKTASTSNAYARHAAVEKSEMK